VTHAAKRLLARFVAVQITAWGATGLLVVAFAPRLLLLDAAVVDGSASLALWAWIATIAVVVGITLAAAKRPLRVVDRLWEPGAPVSPTDVLALYSVPARLVGLGLAGTIAVAAASLAPPLRPGTNDLATQAELALLAVTMASVAVLPAYIAMRASVASIMELVSVAISREAIEQLEARGSGVSRVRQRLLAAVAGPVGFVALGASLLVQAHLRAFDVSSREDEAVELAQGVFGSAIDLPAPSSGHGGVPVGVRGSGEAIEEASVRGFEVRLERSAAPFQVAHDDEGNTRITVPLSDGHAVVRFHAAPISPGTGIGVALALGAVAIAGILGWRIGCAFAADVALATRELEQTGVAEVLRGGWIRGDARFQSVAALMRAADALGGVFREFASAQQRAIDARAVTERMRALFLASMSHDLKAPLNAILGFANLVSRGQLSNAQRESVGIIEQRGRELLYLIDTVLDAARVEAGELSVSPEWSDASDFVMSAVLEARSLTVGQDIAITGEIQSGLPRVLVDSARLAQSLSAIILVATRFAEHGRVVVRASLPAVEAQLRIDVEVTGRVVAAEDRKKVFDAFKHADHARRHGSLGLGPSLARAIVELHGGGIDVETNEAGRTVFHMWVPSERPSRVPTLPGPTRS
jgi:signal transduction histidine kinase